MSIDRNLIAIGAQRVAWDLDSQVWTYKYDGKNLDFLEAIVKPATGYTENTLNYFWDFGGALLVQGNSVVISYPNELSGKRRIKNDGTFNTDKTISQDGAVYTFETQ